MSHDHEKETVMKSMKNGACDFLVKPVSKEVIAVLWRHVYLKRMSKSGLDTQKDSDDDDDNGLGQDNNDLYQSNEEGSKNVEDSGEQDDFDRKGEKNSKKPRMTWTTELHNKFGKAVEKLAAIGSKSLTLNIQFIDLIFNNCYLIFWHWQNAEAYPKNILKYMQEEMNVQGLSRNNVASHLQVIDIYITYSFYFLVIFEKPIS